MPTVKKSWSRKKLVAPVNTRIGYWRVLGEADVAKFPSGSSKTRWICECVCGRVALVLTINLRNGTSTSCGCERNKALINNRRGANPRKAKA